SASDRRAMLGVHSVDHSCGNVTLFTAQFLGRSIVMQATHPKAGFRPQSGLDRFKSEIDARSPVASKLEGE
ncbi:MAG TPA: hypothetical protein VN641_05825, partial [Urbifossiella sp.]|nr:hypothetical protein [Urbifossiella sp.]